MITKEQADEIKRLAAGAGATYIWADGFEARNAYIDSLVGEDEPVAEVKIENDYWNRGHFFEGSRKCLRSTADIERLPVGTRLYRSPQPPVQRQPMTDEEMFRLITRTFESVEHVDRESLSCALVRAVERFHKIGDEA